ncbi:MAG: glycosyltransferase [Acidimicrobiia bacterium]
MTFSVICPVYNTRPAFLQECVKSVTSQTLSTWELILVDDASTQPDTRTALALLASSDERIQVIRLGENVGIAGATNAGARVADGQYLVFLDHDDVLAPTALEWLSSCTEADLIYTDEDKIYEDGTLDQPFFKPSWSPRLLLGVNYINHITCIRKALFDEVGGLRTGIDGAQDHDLLLRISELPISVAHVPNVLYHWRVWSESAAGRPSSKIHIEEIGLRVIAEAIARRGWNAHAALGNGRPFNYRVIWEAEPEPPFVKVIMPTRDHMKMLRRAVNGVLERTDGVRTHLVIVDNGSRHEKTLSYLAELDQRDDVTVHRIDDAFNYSRLCNEGVNAGPSAPLILLLNNDIEVLHRNWLLQLSGWLRDPTVAGVGVKLLFPNRTIQHAGVIVGLGGLAGHYAGEQPDEPQLSNLHDQAREVSCLTAACLLLRTDDYLKIGGMNEDLALDFQDVDFCLRLHRDLGGSFVYDPTYPLIHLQSASRGKLGAASGYTVSRMEFLWQQELERPDPYYSPHLTLAKHDFRLAAIPPSTAARLARLEPRFIGESIIE